MNLQETTDTLIKWAKSCDNQQQLDLLADKIDVFISDRFEDAPFFDIVNATCEVADAIRSQRSWLTQSFTP